MARARKPKLAVWKFSSCDGCQLSLLDCEDELLALAGAVEIAYFLEASSAPVGGPYDLSLVEGSITTPHDLERIQRVRKASKYLVTIGACATAGGIQALRNFASLDDYLSVVYASPEYVSTLASSTPIGEHIPVDFELRGCPINKRQLVEVISVVSGRSSSGYFASQRLPRVQATRQRLRHGGARHSVPWSRDTRRLWCALSLLQPWLLWLLRTDGDAEHRVTEPAWITLGASPSTIHRAYRPSTPMPNHSVRRARTMPTRTIKVDNLARVEGEGALFVRIRDGQLTDIRISHLRAAALFRSAAARSSLQEAPDITARIAASARLPTR